MGNPRVDFWQKFLSKISFAETSRKVKFLRNKIE